MSTIKQLPLPRPEALAHSQQLVQLIQQVISDNGGPISFAEFMRLALYAPTLGYYSAGNQKFGASGDFVTAPEISPLFAQCLARTFAPILATTQGDVLELGAGSGRMAADLLTTLHQLHHPPRTYYILEVSADLRQRQQQYLAQQIPTYFSHIQWLEQLPNQFSGVMVANEVLDALPVHRFTRTQDSFAEIMVDIDHNTFKTCTQSSDNPALIQALSPLLPTLPVGYQSEISLTMPALLHSLNDCLHQGLMLFLDYGFLAHEYYHHDRVEGTLMCHYRHYAHSNPFLYPGLQDITAHVNFTALGDTAIQAGLDVSGFATQAQYLIDAGLIALVEGMQQLDTAQRIQLNQQIQTLTAPHEMGELFKVMAFSRNIEQAVVGFQ